MWGIPPPPLFRLAAGLLQDPLSHRNDEPRLFGQRNELNRRQKALLGMLPTQQSLEPDDPTISEEHLWLIVQLELSVLESAPEISYRRANARSRSRTSRWAL
jgi:hypothetical protein